MEQCLKSCDFVMHGVSEVLELIELFEFMEEGDMGG